MSNLLETKRAVGLNGGGWRIVGELQDTGSRTERHADPGNVLIRRARRASFDNEPARNGESRRDHKRDILYIGVADLERYARRHAVVTIVQSANEIVGSGNDTPNFEHALFIDIPVAEVLK